MQSFKQTFNHLVSEKPSQLILGIVFVIYILLNVHTPSVIAGPIDTIYGKVLVVVIAAIVFMKTNPVIGVLGFVVAYQIIKTASITTGNYAIKHYLPSERSKERELKSYNVIAQTSTIAPASISVNASGLVLPGTLEEETVDRMAPLVIRGDDNSPSSFKPILDGQHGASSLF